MRRLLRIGFLVSIAMCMLNWNGCTPTHGKPYNLVFSTDAADPNGFMLNALWTYQYEGLKGNTPGQGPIPLNPPNEPWTASPTDWDIGSDSGIFCSGHKNWVDIGGRLRGGTYTGLLTWESHSGAWPFDDNDYSFNLKPMSLTGGPNGAGLQAHEDHIHVEYNLSEVGGRFDSETPWWQAFHYAVDHGDSTPTPFDMLTSKTSTVVGLMGMDTAHPPPNSEGNGGETELHPIWAMAMRVKEQTSADSNSADETYAFMARNWGDEGFCASGEWILPVSKLAILIPWRQGARTLTGGGEFSIVNAPNSNLGDNVSATIIPGRGLLLEFQLVNQPQTYVGQNGQQQVVPPDENGTVIEGEVGLQWGGSLVDAPPSNAAPTKSNQEGETGPEGSMRQLVEKMTPQQRAGFLAATATKPVPKHSVRVKLKPFAQLAALPVPPKTAPEIRFLTSPRREQMEKTRMEALHSIFGATIPGLTEKNQATPK